MVKFRSQKFNIGFDGENANFWEKKSKHLKNTQSGEKQYETPKNMFLMCFVML